MPTAPGHTSFRVRFTGTHIEEGACPMRLFKNFAAFALLLAAAAPAFADIALPKKPTPDPNEIRRDLPTARMTIERVEGLREARLQIPGSRLQELRLAAGIDAGGGQSASLKSA